MGPEQDEIRGALPTMKSRLVTVVATAIAIFCTPSPAYADGGGPLLLLFNLPLFTVGQLWIVGVEWLLLRTRITVPGSTLLWWVVAANLLSAAICAFGLPILWAALTAFASVVAGDSELGRVLTALGTWFVGDRSPYPRLAVIAAGVGFVVTFLPTVWIELRFLRRMLEKRDQQVPGLTRCVVVANLASYAGLVVMIALAFALGVAD
jgi:hypothetical protein